jgi:hypothetical protein
MREKKGFAADYKYALPAKAAPPGRGLGMARLSTYGPGP